MSITINSLTFLNKMELFARFFGNSGCDKLTFDATPSGCSDRVVKPSEKGVLLLTYSLWKAEVLV